MSPPRSEPGDGDRDARDERDERQARRERSRRWLGALAVLALVLLALAFGVFRLRAERLEQRAQMGLDDPPVATMRAFVREGLLDPTAAETPGPEGYALRGLAAADRLELEVGGRTATVRLLGLRAPTGQACGGRIRPEAEAAARALIGEGPLRLAGDPAAPERDAQGGLPRHVWLADGRQLGLELLRDGYLRLDDAAPAHAWRDVYGEAEEEARGARAGLWALPCTEGRAPRPLPEARPVASADLPQPSGGPSCRTMRQILSSACRVIRLRWL